MAKQFAALKSTRRRSGGNRWMLVVVYTYKCTLNTDNVVHYSIVQVLYTVNMRRSYVRLHVIW